MNGCDKQPCIILMRSLYEIIHICLLCEHTEDFLDDFPKISEHFLKVIKKLFKDQTIIFEYFPKISEDNRRFLRKIDVSILQKHICVLFKGLCNHGNGYL